MPEIDPGVLFVGTHGFWRNPQQLIVGKVTLQIDTPLGTFRREYEITAGDIIGFFTNIMNLMSTVAVAHAVPVKQYGAANVPLASAALTTAQQTWPG